MFVLTIHKIFMPLSFLTIDGYELTVTCCLFPLPLGILFSQLITNHWLLITVLCLPFHCQYEGHTVLCQDLKDRTLAITNQLSAVIPRSPEEASGNRAGRSKKNLIANNSTCLTVSFLV